MNAQFAPQPGAEVFLEESAADYQRRELGTASSGALNLLLASTPAHYKAWCESEDDDETPAKAFGRAYHMRVLEPARFFETYIAAPADPPTRPSDRLRNAKKPSQSTLDAIAWWDEWNDENQGKTVLPAEAFGVIEEMHAALVAHPLVAGIMRNGIAEASIRWRDEVTGVPCKARPDWWVRGKFMVDVKTTDDVSPAVFAKTVHKYGYHVQEAHYCDGARSLGEPVEHYLIVAQEKTKPYAVAVYAIDSFAESRGFELRERALTTLAECAKTNTYPGYPTGINQLSLPAWALKD